MRADTVRGTHHETRATPAQSGPDGEAGEGSLQPPSDGAGAKEGRQGPKRGPNDTTVIRTDILPDFVASFWARTAWMLGGLCRPWMMAKNGLGYGVVWNGERLSLAHRVAWTLTHGPIPRGVVVDHLCKNPACCNPAHMELVTQRENTLRGNSPNAIARRTGIRKCGHKLDERRSCRECSTQRQREKRAAAKESASAIASACALGLIAGLALSAILAPRAFAAVVLFLAGQGAAS